MAETESGENAPPAASEQALATTVAAAMHDLNNVLAVVQTSAYVLEGATLTPVQRDALYDLLGALNRGKGVVAELLDAARSVQQ